MITNINNLKDTLTEKQYFNFKNTRIRLANKNVVSSIDYLKELFNEGYKIIKGDKNSFVLTKNNSGQSVVLNACEAKVFNVLFNGGTGVIKANGYSTYKIS